MKLLLTGGSGDLGKVLCPQLKALGHKPVVVDVRPPGNGVEFVETSIIDRSALSHSMDGIDMVIHIAAWHGVHEFRREKNVYDFWDLNVQGTFNVFQCAAEAGINKVIFISSTSIEDRVGLYGHTKVLSEEIARTYAARHAMNVLTLRPRAFIPHWNRTVYSSYVEWAKWFWGGAVHITDVSGAVVKGVDLLASTRLEQALFLPVDGAYEFTDMDLASWDKDGPGTTFKQYYPRHFDTAVKSGLSPEAKPTKLDISETKKWIGYEPQYSLKNLLEELERYGEAGPPAPNFTA